MKNHAEGEATPTQERANKEHGRECIGDVGEGVVECDGLDGQELWQQEDGGHQPDLSPRH